MKLKSLLAAIFAASLLLAACGNGGNEESAGEAPADDEIRSLEVDLEVPETAGIEETATFTAHVHSNGEDVTDADKVRFEVLDSEGNSLDMIEAEHSENGLYTIDYEFEAAGEYTVISHVDAFQLHTMPEKQITVE